MATSAHFRCRCRGDVQSQPDTASSALGRRTRMQARGAALTLRWASPAAYCQEANELRAAKKALLRTATDDLAEMCSLRQVPWPCGVHRSHRTRTSLLALLAIPCAHRSLSVDALLRWRRVAVGGACARGGVLVCSKSRRSSVVGALPMWHWRRCVAVAQSGSRLPAGATQPCARIGALTADRSCPTPRLTADIGLLDARAAPRGLTPHQSVPHGMRHRPWRQESYRGLGLAAHARLVPYQAAAEAETLQTELRTMRAALAKTMCAH
jgi:hypothetical protein